MAIDKDKARIIDNKQQINDFFKELFDYQRSGNYIFRGISKKEHYLPTLFREGYKATDPSSTVQNYEKKLLERFGRYSIQY